MTAQSSPHSLDDGLAHEVTRVNELINSKAKPMTREPSLTELRAVAEKATPGPWEIDGGTVIVSTAPWPMEHGPSWCDWAGRNDEAIGRFVGETRTAEIEGEDNAEFWKVFNPLRLLALLTRLERAEEIVSLARELVSPAGMVNRGVDRGLVVIEKADKSDPHYRLCTALQALGEP